MLRLKSFGYGLLLTLITTLLSWGLTVSTFDRNLFYLAKLLPVFFAFYLLIAWLIYLRKEDKLLHTERVGGSPQPLGTENMLLQDLPEQKVTGEELANLPVDKHGLLQRRDTSQREPDLFWRNTLYVMLWSSIQLALIATALYYWFGIGASFF